MIPPQNLGLAASEKLQFLNNDNLRKLSCNLLYLTSHSASIIVLTSVQPPSLEEISSSRTFKRRQKRK